MVTKEYKVLENPPNFEGCELLLNEYAQEGWVLVGFGQYQMVIERNKQDENKTIKQING